MHVGDKVETQLFGKTYIGNITRLLDNESCEVEMPEPFVHHFFRNRLVKKLCVKLARFNIARAIKYSVFCV